MRKYAEKPKNYLNGQVDFWYKLTEIYKLGWNRTESNKPDNWGIAQIFKYIKWADS